jgi:hypothetical protein
MPVPVTIQHGSTLYAGQDNGQLAQMLHDCKIKEVTEIVGCTKTEYDCLGFVDYDDCNDWQMIMLYNITAPASIRGEGEAARDFNTKTLAFASKPKPKFSVEYSGKITATKEYRDMEEKLNGCACFCPSNWNATPIPTKEFSRMLDMEGMLLKSGYESIRLSFEIKMMETLFGKNQVDAYFDPIFDITHPNNIVPYKNLFDTNAYSLWDAIVPNNTKKSSENVANIIRNIIKCATEIRLPEGSKMFCDETECPEVLVSEQLMERLEIWLGAFGYGKTNSCCDTIEHCSGMEVPKYNSDGSPNPLVLMHNKFRFTVCDQLFDYYKWKNYESNWWIDMDNIVLSPLGSTDPVVGTPDFRKAFMIIFPERNRKLQALQRHFDYVNKYVDCFDCNTDVYSRRVSSKGWYDVVTGYGMYLNTGV